MNSELVIYVPDQTFLLLLHMEICALLLLTLMTVFRLGTWLPFPSPFDLICPLPFALLNPFYRVISCAKSIYLKHFPLDGSKAILIKAGYAKLLPKKITLLKLFNFSKFLACWMANFTTVI